MIYLSTGLPGAGKTLFTIQKILKYLEDFKKETGIDRKVYYFNVEFEKTHLLYDKVKDWIKVDSQDLTVNLPLIYDNNHSVIEQKSIIFIDECQDIYPVRNKGAVPSFLKFFEKHRHTGCDFFLVTQKIRQIDIHLRELVGEHSSYERIFSRNAVKIKTLNKIIDEKSFDSAEIETNVKKYPKELFGLYKSAVLHTHKKKLPVKIVYGVPLILLFIFLMIYWGYSILFKSKSNVEIENNNLSDIKNSSFLYKKKSLFSLPSDSKIYLSTVLKINNSFVPVFILYSSSDSSKIILYSDDLQKMGDFKVVRNGVYFFNGKIILHIPRVSTNEKSVIGNNN